MADGVVRLAPDSTGSYLHTRTRTVNSQTVHEEYVRSLDSDRVTASISSAATFRIPVRAVAAAGSQPLLTMLNSASATAVIGIRRIAVEVDSIVARTALAPWIRTVRISAHAGGTAVTPVTYDASTTLNATGLAILADASADGTNSTTALSATVSNANFIWQQVLPRWQTLVGYGTPGAIPMLPDDGGIMEDTPFMLRAGQGLMIRLDSPAALTAGDYHFGVKVAFEEFTLP